jgi:hypothetical protein
MTKLNSLARARVIGPEGGAEVGAGVGEGAASVDVLVVSSSASPPNGRTREIVRDYASPQCEDIKVQESDSKLEATKYVIKARIIEMAAATQFRGMETENPYRHIRHFTTLCNTVRLEGVPDEWLK